MFKILFYFFGFIAIYYEFWSVQNHNKVRNLINRFTKPSKEVKLAVMTEIEALFVAMQLLYGCWAAVGLFTSQWLIFLLIFVLSAISYKMKENKIWSMTDALLTSALILFAIINTFHLHIPLLQRIIDFYS